MGQTALAIVVPAVLHLVTHRARFWRDYPLVEFAIWLAWPFLVLEAFTMAIEASGRVVNGLGWIHLTLGMALFQIIAPWVLIAGTVFALWLSPEPVNMGVDLGRGLARRLRRRLPASLYGWLPVLVALVLVAILALPAG
jgi:hypothetical protein